MELVYLDTALLEKVWQRYIKEHNLYSNGLTYLAPKFCDTSQYFFQRKQFDAWLFDQGASIRRTNKKYYLEFAIGDKSTLFGLMYL